MCSSTIPWLTLSFNYCPNNVQQPPLSRLSSGPVGLFKAPVPDGPQSAAVYLSITHSEAKRWRSLSQSHQHLHPKLLYQHYFMFQQYYIVFFIWKDHWSWCSCILRSRYGDMMGKKYRMRGNIIFQWFCVHSQNFSFLSQKVLCSSRETWNICIILQNYCIPLKRKSIEI